MKNLIYTVIALLFLFSCTKEKNKGNEKVTITGTIVTDCAGTPYANQDFVLLKHGNRTFGDNGEEIYFTTDNSGSFSAECSPSDAVNHAEIRVGRVSGKSILIFNTENDLNIGTLNTTPTANYQIKIKVNNTYALGDTLIINDHKGGGITYKFPAPLTDTILSVVNNYSNALQIPNLENINKVSVVSTTYVYSGTSGTSSFLAKFNKNNYLFFEGCTSNVQEETVIID